MPPRNDLYDSLRLLPFARRRRRRHTAPITIAGAMSAPFLMVAASLLFATMGVCVKLASAHYATGEIVFYRGLIGALFIASMTRLRGGSLRTTVPAMHFWRSLSGVCALCLWFYAIGNLPLATAMTLNYSSSVWMALYLIGGAAVVGSARVDGRLILAVLLVGEQLQHSMELGLIAHRPIGDYIPTWNALKITLFETIGGIIWISLVRHGQPQLGGLFLLIGLTIEHVVQGAKIKVDLESAFRAGSPGTTTVPATTAVTTGA
jgi:hypothetical protein